MNKFILLALVATAYARECATAEELGNADFAKYKLKYKFTENYSDKDDLTKAMPIGFDVKDKTCGKDCWYFQMGVDTEFKIKGSLDAANVSTGFRIYSENEKQVLSLNQGKVGYGYYMYDKKDEYIDTGRYSSYTLMNYDYADKRLSQGTKSLGVNIGNKNLISQTGTLFGAYETKFCFVKVRVVDSAKSILNSLFNTVKGISKEMFDENMEALQGTHPALYSALTAEGDETWTEKVQELAKKELEKELKNQLDKAANDGKDKLKEQLKNLKGLKTKQQAIEMWNSLQGKGEKKSEDGEETEQEQTPKRKGKKDHTNDEDEDDQKPKKGENKKDVRDNVLGDLKQNNVLGDLKGQNVLGDLKGQNVLGDLKEQNNFLGDLKGQNNVLGNLKGQNNELAKGITSAKEDGSSVQTPFALSALILLLLVN